MLTDPHRKEQDFGLSNLTKDCVQYEIHFSWKAGRTGRSANMSMRKRKGLTVPEVILVKRHFSRNSSIRPKLNI